MIDRQQAEVIAEAHVRDLPRLGSPECILLPQETLEEPFGWVFFYQSREYIETGRSSTRVAGNAPLLVLRQTGELRVLGTGLPLENYLAAYRGSVDSLVHWSIRAMLPRPWLRGLAVAWALTGSLWIVTLVLANAAARSGGRESGPNGALTLLVGVLMLPVGMAAARNLDGMAQIWGRQALAPFRRRVPFGLRLENVERPEDVYRLERVGQEGLGRQMGGLLILLSLFWIAFGLGILTGLLHN
jgi:hypothetical protein